MVHEVSRQYRDSEKLAARARLNREHTIAPTPWFVWVGQQLGLGAGDVVLDVGCGPGWFWVEMAQSLPPGIKLTLTDSSPGMVAEAVERCRRLPFASVEGLEADAARLPFADGSFDKVLAMHMLYHLKEPALGIAEMFRVLKPGGVLAVTTNGAGNMREIHQLTGVFGAAPVDPAAAAFGLEAAEPAMRARFGNAALLRYPAQMRITSEEDVFLALTSFPPGDGAGEAQIKAFRQAIAQAFQEGGGVLEVTKETGLVISRKPGS